MLSGDLIYVYVQIHSNTHTQLSFPFHTDLARFFSLQFSTLPALSINTYFKFYDTILADYFLVYYFFTYI